VLRQPSRLVKPWGHLRGTRPVPEDHVVLPFARDLPGTVTELAHGDVDRGRRVTRVPLVLLPHVQQVGVLRNVSGSHGRHVVPEIHHTPMEPCEAPLRRITHAVSDAPLRGARAGPAPLFGRLRRRTGQRKPRRRALGHDVRATVRLAGGHAHHRGQDLREGRGEVLHPDLRTAGRRPPQGRRGLRGAGQGRGPLRPRPRRPDVHEDLRGPRGRHGQGHLERQEDRHPLHPRGRLPAQPLDQGGPPLPRRPRAELNERFTTDSHPGPRCRTGAAPRGRGRWTPRPPWARYLRRRDRRRSARGLPPVWQVGQYWRDESANDTSRIVPPHTGHFWPVRACTRRPVFFSPLRSWASRPRDRSTASRRVVTMASCRVATSSSVRVAAILKGDILAACSTSSEQAWPLPAITLWSRSSPLIWVRLPSTIAASAPGVNASSSGSGPRDATPGTSAGSRTT